MATFGVNPAENMFHDAFTNQNYNVNTSHPLIPNSQNYMFYKKYNNVCLHLNRLKKWRDQKKSKYYKDPSDLSTDIINLIKNKYATNKNIEKDISLFKPTLEALNIIYPLEGLKKPTKTIKDIAKSSVKLPELDLDSDNEVEDVDFEELFENGPEPEDTKITTEMRAESESEPYLEEVEEGKSKKITSSSLKNTSLLDVSLASFSNEIKSAAEDEVESEAIGQDETVGQSESIDEEEIVPVKKSLSSFVN